MASTLQQQPQQPGSPIASRDTYNTAITSVPEDDVLHSQASELSHPSSPSRALKPRQQQQQQYVGVEASEGAEKPRRGLAALLGCSCFGGGGTRMVVEEQDGRTTTKVIRDPTLPRSISVTKDGTYCHIPSRKVSRKGSSMMGGSMRRWSTLRRAGSLAYSDADWFDAMSSWEGSGDLGDVGYDDRDSMMAEVDQLVKELGAGRGPWVPEPPLAFAVPNMHFMPIPERTGFAAYWMRDEERTTPPPQPIDVMLKASWVVQKSHNSIPGVFFEETDNEFKMTVKPRFVPPGFPRYQEYYDKTNNTEPSWALRRDLKTGRSYGKIYMTSDNTLIMRVWTKPMWGNDVDLITEEYMRLEEDGQVIVARQCCLDVKSGKRAVQYLVGRRYEAPPKGHI